MIHFKKITALLISLTIILTIVPAAYASTVVKSSQIVYVNGVQQSLNAYNIDGSNYFKLRDIAYVLNNTDSKFSVSYDSDSQSIAVSTKTSYSTVGGEMALGVDESGTAIASGQSLKVNGTTTSLAAYNIGGSNYFKLRDLGSAIGFTVNYSNTASAIIIKSSDYVGADIKDGTKNNPYSFGDRIELNFVGTDTSKSGKLYFTAIDYLNPAQMSSTFNSSMFEAESTRWYIYAKVELSKYSKDAACNFTDAICSSCIVTNNLVNCNYYSWYINPAAYQMLSLYAGGKSDCYIPVETKEITQGDTAKFFSITYYVDNKYTKKTIWIAMP
ncbi:MAG: hypothetical protein CVU91_12295 [Firmicutes bacterium HGW-Firmicutes-16]|nr:MAG: hypothetical protein CVU91_12295 [Firmicutes bacterium HGW-Firmicutes-16]